MAKNLKAPAGSFNRSNKIKNSQKGVSLIIAFLIMTIILAAVLGFSTILFNKTKILGNIGNAISSLYAANTGVEKTYYLKKSAGNFCNICAVCTDCFDCTLSPLATDGCSLSNCTNCKLTYNSAFDDRTYRVEATLSPNPLNPPNLSLCVNSKGSYRDTTRTVNQCILVQDMPGSSEATLVINKLTPPELGGTFTYTISGDPPIAEQSITTDSDGEGSTSTTVSLRSASTYTITENLPPPPDGKTWVVSSSCATPGYGNWTGNEVISGVTMTAGQTTTCKFVNEATERPPLPSIATLVIKKRAASPGGTFTFTMAGNPPIPPQSITIPSNGGIQSTSTTVSLSGPSTYTIIENHESFWNVISSTCSTPGYSMWSGTDTISGVILVPGQTTNCSFVNEFTSPPPPSP